jgi:fatty-acyl-CoA synthase
VSHALCHSLHRVVLQKSPDGRILSYAFTKSDLTPDYATLGVHLSRAAKSNPDKTALISCHENTSLTYSQIDNAVTRISENLRRAFNFKVGDVISLWSTNSVDSILIQYAAARLGLIMCTINPSYREKELEYVLQKSGAKAIFLPGHGSRQETVNKFMSVLRGIPLSNLQLQHVITLDGDPGVKMESLSSFTLDSFRDGKGSAGDENPEFTADSPSIIMFTSGTTGNPKGAVLSHYNMINNAAFTASRLSLNHNDVAACIPVPLFHVFGMVYGSVMMSVASVPIVLTGYKYNAKSVVEAIAAHKCTHTMIVPAMTVDILGLVEKMGHNPIPSLKYVVTGSAPTPPDVAKKFVAKIPSVKHFYIRYGSTETGGCMTMPFPADSPETTCSSVGAPLDLTQVKVCDPKSGKEVEVGKEGEIWVRGHHVMLGYWKDDVKTAEAIENGWFKTGDVGVMGKDGYISLVGRIKEMIIRGGENIYPKEIENLLHQHQQVYEAFVCGVPDPRLGEQVCAWVKLKDPSSGVTEKELQSFCEGKISKFKIPRYILFVDEFPRTPTGKAQKFAMTEQSIKILKLNQK